MYWSDWSQDFRVLEGLRGGRRKGKGEGKEGEGGHIGQFYTFIA